MIINFLYCVDFPSRSDKLETSNKIEGWLLCSKNISEIRILDGVNNGCLLEYGLSRPDVIQHYKEFSNNDKCGFRLIADQDPINLKNELILELTIDSPEENSKKFIIALDYTPSIIRQIEVDSEEELSDIIQEKIEEKFSNTLKEHPWLTIRMDITNKCNLKCIMCHYKEEEIYSQPTKNITAEQLKHLLKDIAPYVKNIMLSCGFEPLMSKHFYEIASMLNSNFPHMEIGMCTNGMLLNSKARKTIIENNITHVLLSFDGVTKKTLEKIRVGASYEKIIGNIMALRDLKKVHNRNFPLLFMDFVLMNSNIHEAPAFVELCSLLGIGIIDFRHLVGNIYFSEHDEMLSYHKGKYNYFRQLIVEESIKFNIDVRLPEPFDNVNDYIPEDFPSVDLSDFMSVSPDLQTEEIIVPVEIIVNPIDDTIFEFLSGASCLRPFNEIMIIDQEKILPCAFYNDSMGNINENNTLYSIFYNKKYMNVRKKKMLSRYDHNCTNCPIMSNLLPTEVAK
jgi:MoaA/NifB/PqqE/SkfB family radical SAM enzyme